MFKGMLHERLQHVPLMRASFRQTPAALFDDSIERGMEPFATKANLGRREHDSARCDASSSDGQEDLRRAGRLQEARHRGRQEAAHE